MRLLHLVHQFPPDHIGGVELHTQAVARELARRGHEVTVLFRRSADGVGLERWQDTAAEPPLDLPPRVIAAHAGRVAPTGRFLATFHDPPMARLLEAVIQEAQPEVIHIQHLMGLPDSVIGAMRRHKIPYVVTLHDFWWGCANAQLLTNDREALCEGPRAWVNCGRCALARAGQPGALWLAPALAPLFAFRHGRLRAVLAGASRIVVPTAFTREAYRKMGFAVERMTVIPHGISLHEGTGSRPPRAPQPGLRVAYVGGISRQKGVDVLIEAVNGLPDRAITLDIMGDLAAMPDFAAHLMRLAAHPGIRLEGALPNAQVRALLPTFDVLVVPSIWYETAALVIQEAFAAGVPVIASDLGALRERVRHGVDGLLVPPDDPVALRAALSRLMDEPELLPRLRAGIGPVRGLPQQVADFEALYRAIA